MKVVAYNIKPFEKEFLAKANQKKHDITLISNPLTAETAAYAEGKDAVIVFANDDVSAPIIDRLAGLGIKYIATRCAGTGHIDKKAAALRGIRLANVPDHAPESVAEYTVALALSLSRHLTKAEEQIHHFDFTLDELVGFDLGGKTVGIIGLGDTGLATARLFHGLGCIIVGYDDEMPALLRNITPVSLQDLLSRSDIISIHTSTSPRNGHVINSKIIDRMKTGVMLLNTARGALIDTIDVLQGVKSGKIAYLGIDTYEYEKELLFADHGNDRTKDPLLQELLSYPNVMVTPHQAFLTRESLQLIADQTIKNLDQWQQQKCVGNACICDQKCDEKSIAKSGRL
ncbi:MAG: 2-hydroxyacid dehydrogenase [Mucilaginibacter sp.]|uniref:2-hydroxyacid dehydrogenase n=1 Tax=Mucilaginibacter sp. TaxID=1882438 RepID=UPI003262E605